MSGKQFQSLRKTELKSSNANFDFSDILRNASNNDYWYQKEGLWTVISAACNEAATEYYVQMNDYIKNLADIDMCNIHALKSIAKSVGCQYLTDFIKEDYPVQLLNLINLLSIPKHILFDSYQKLNYFTIAPIMGSINLRNIILTPSKYYRSILYNTASNDQKLKTLLEQSNLFDCNKYIFDIINTLFNIDSEFDSFQFLNILNLSELYETESNNTYFSELYLLVSTDYVKPLINLNYKSQHQPKRRWI